ncbi:hypothetical protein OG875_05290 [Streptomyces sp. NBC_01498]|uniref:hypothetical protein n=1 Tax=Streptomyces sp. NBC_01498 TaxID=2975870 RepID=UPI002E7C2594|nr:hypothetical protein [Streptomyces sp. NBC_01498]WTL24073.1 hypothetical protein OG875_05290 [Streptomyces sp. NBC_01498]
MAAPTDHDSHRRRILGELVKQQRRALGYSSKEKAAEAVGLSHVPYRNVENGLAVSDLTYTKVELAFGLLPGSCRAFLDGADSIKLTDGGELIPGARSWPSLADIDARAREAIQAAVEVTAPDLSVGQAKELALKALEELRKRDLLPKPE